MNKTLNTEKKKILFVCLGNICRSPAAEGIMKNKLKEKGLAEYYFIDSAGISGYHEGQLPDSRMRAHAADRGYNLNSRSRPVVEKDFYDFDLIIGMDESNIDALNKKAPEEQYKEKIKLMTDYCVNIEADHVPDPYYGGAYGFELVLDILEDACEGLIEKLRK